MGTGQDLVRTERLCLGVEEVGSNPPPGEESKRRLSPTSSPTDIPPKNTPPPMVGTPSHVMVVDREERGPGERGAGRTDPAGSERPPASASCRRAWLDFSSSATCSRSTAQFGQGGISAEEKRRDGEGEGRGYTFTQTAISRLNQTSAGEHKHKH